MTTVILIALLVVPFLVNLVAWWLNLRVLARASGPPESQVLERRRFRQMQAYTQAKIKLAAAAAAWGLAATLGCWWVGGFSAVAALVGRSLWNPVLAGVAYLGCFLLARRLLLLLPFQLAQHFVVDARFGLNRYTWATFAADFVKWRLVYLVVHGVAAAGVLAPLTFGGPHRWWLAWLAVAAWSIVVSWTYPQLVRPLFNRYAPLPAGPLQQRIADMSRQLNFPLAGIFVMDTSRQSALSDATCMGFGRHRRIAVSDTLLPRHPIEEIAAIVAHEIGHARYRHFARQLVGRVALQGLAFILLAQFLARDAMFAAFGLPERSAAFGLTLFLLFWTAWQTLLEIPIKWYYRRAEYQADAFAAAAVGNPEVVAVMLERLAGDNLANPAPHPFFVFLHAFHPTIRERIAALRRLPSG